MVSAIILFFNCQRPDYFQIELLGYDNAQKVDFYVLRLESEEEPILILTDTDYTDGWKYTNENISDIISYLTV